MLRPSCAQALGCRIRVPWQHDPTAHGEVNISSARASARTQRQRATHATGRSAAAARARALGRPVARAAGGHRGHRPARRVDQPPAGRGAWPRAMMQT